MLTQARLRTLLTYDPETGEFRWRVQRGGKPVGTVAGTLRDNGYLQIMIDRVCRRAHRLAWLYVVGEWPVGSLDHIDGDPLNNRIANLRLADGTQNNANAKMHHTNKSGHRGVHFDRSRGKWVAYISAHGRRRHLGYFDDIAAAIAVRRAAALEAFGEFARFH